ncbi:MAG: 2-dehydropantoate 2-reductase [Desulfobacterales bacterium]|nr:MAG: 2-dehydropantoate 2-reductase [Desulfobacterales bacterium]
MKERKMAVVGLGATGTVLAAALLSQFPETVLVGRNPDAGETLLSEGIHVAGVINYQTPVKNFVSRIKDLKDDDPDLVFLATKTFHLDQVLEEMEDVYRPGIKIVSTQNGLGTEDLIAEKFGAGAALRMSLNYGASLIGPGQAQTAFFNRPNHLGALTPENRVQGLQIADILTDCGLETEYVEDIKLFVWKKMIMKCTMASICAVTNKTIKDALDYAPTREIADACFNEALAVAKAMGYDLGEDYLSQAMGYLEKVGIHRDSMCFDIEKKTPTEIDFLGAKIVAYARQKGISTPFYVAMTNMVKAIEDNYLERTDDR